MACSASRPVGIILLVAARHSPDLPPDVYSYNFPDDRRSLKFIGESSNSYLHFPSIHREFRLAYFIFILETVQTVLSGSDVYYWFVAGFGDMSRLRHTHFASINGSVLDAPISLIVQGFYCYRIWTLRKRWWWLCVVIAIVRLFSFAV